MIKSGGTMDSKQIKAVLHQHDNHGYEERLTHPDVISFISKTLDNNKNKSQQEKEELLSIIISGLIKIQESRCLNLMFKYVVQAQNDALSVGTGLSLLKDSQIKLIDSDNNLSQETSAVLESGSFARSRGLGFAALQRAGILDTHKHYVLEAGRNGGSIGKALEVLHHCGLLDKGVQAKVLASGNDAFSIAMGLDRLQQEEICEQEQEHVIKAGKYGMLVGAAISELKKYGKLNTRNRSIITSTPEQAVINAQKIISGSSQFRPVLLNNPLVSKDRGANLGVVTADDVRLNATNPIKFYSLDGVKTHTFDLPNVRYDRAHRVEEIRKMSFLFNYLEKNNSIPKTEQEILSTIDNLVSFANNLNDVGLDSNTGLAGTRRMFKLGIDKLLRDNQRVSSIKDWSSRALVLGVFKGILDYQRENPTQNEIIIKLKTAFIMGVRQVVESDEKSGARACRDRVCRTAAGDGFFASKRGEAINTNEVYDLSDVNPACHGRMRNLSQTIAELIGYHHSVKNDIEIILNNFSIVDYKLLLNKIDSAISDGLSPLSMSMNETDEDKYLYSFGIDEVMFGHFVQIYLDQVPDGLNMDDCTKLKNQILNANLEQGKTSVSLVR